MAIDWSTAEVEATVTDYLEMLKAYLGGMPLFKAGHRRLLQPLLNGRSEAAIRYKYSNISAVLVHLGVPYLSGYKPLENFQRSLFDVVLHQVASDPDFLKLVQRDADSPIIVPGVDEILNALTDPPKPGAGSRKADKLTVEYPTLPVNYLEREAQNRRLGLAGEDFVINFERAWLISIGKEHLASKIEHTSKVKGDAAGYDVLSFEASGANKLIEVKTTKYGRDTPFFVSRNELAVSCVNPQGYYLYRVFGFRETPRLFTLKGALSSTCILDPTTYVATVA